MAVFVNLDSWHARSTTPSLITEGLEYFGNDVCHCFPVSATVLDTTNSAWKQAQLSLSRGGLGLFPKHSYLTYMHNFNDYK